MAKASLARAFALVSGVLTLPLVASLHGIAQSSGPAADVTFTKDISRILQRSCQECHHPDGVALMSLVTYDEVRPWARSLKARTALRSQRGAMPPVFVEKNIGIQKFKHDPSLSDEEIGKIARWADSGAPRGNAADMPKPLNFDDSDKWTIGEPDLVLKSKEVLVPASGPDWWGDIGLVPTGLTEDRYAAAVEVREVNDIPRAGGTKTVGGRYVFHHMTYSSVQMGERGSVTRARRIDTNDALSQRRKAACCAQARVVPLPVKPVISWPSPCSISPTRSPWSPARDPALARPSPRSSPGRALEPW